MITTVSKVRAALQIASESMPRPVRAFWLEFDEDLGADVANVIFVLDPPAGDGWELEELDGYCEAASSALEGAGVASTYCWFRTAAEFESDFLGEGRWVSLLDESSAA